MFSMLIRCSAIKVVSAGEAILINNVLIFINEILTNEILTVIISQSSFLAPI